MLPNLKILYAFIITFTLQSSLLLDLMILMAFCNISIYKNCTHF